MKKLGIGLYLICMCLGLLAQPSSPTPLISIEESDIRVEDLLAEITRQSGAPFSYHAKVVDPDERLAFSVQQATLEECMDQLCKQLPLRYTLVAGQVVLNYDQSRKAARLTLSGFLTDQSTGESLIGGTVYVQGTSRGTFTNEFGYYALSLAPGNYTLVYAHMGYEKKAIPLSLTASRQQNGALAPKSFVLPTVVIEPPLADILNKKQLGEMELNPEALNRIPEFAGEAGLVNSLSSLPGMKAHSDGSAYFYARGGARDQNLIVIDDAPIYNPGHLFGFYSIFLPDFAKSIQVYKSDMPATMGDRLSSIISIRTKDGNLNKFELSGAINPFAYRLSVETPIVKQKSAIFLTLRRSNLEWLYKGNAPQLDLSFGDVHFKWNHKINEKNRLFFTSIWSADFMQSFNRDSMNYSGVRWGNFAATFRWNHVFSPKLFSNTTIYTGTFENRLFITPNFWKSGLGMLSIKTDFTYYAHERFRSKFGLEIQGYFNDPGSVSQDSSLTLLPSLSPNYSRKSVLYYQGEYALGEKFKVSAGLRLIDWTNLGPTSYYTYDEHFQVADTLTVGEGPYHHSLQLDPRISLRYQVLPAAQLKLSVGRYHQFLQMVSNTISPFTPLELWLPATPTVQPQAATQWALSYLQYFKKARLEISAAAYYKHSTNQIDYADHAATYLNPLLEGELRFGTNRSYGLELWIKKDFGRLNGWLGYTYSRVMRVTETLNQGQPYRAFQDRPHDVSLSLQYQTSRRVLWQAFATAYSGSPFTSPIGYFTFNDQPVPIYGERNNDRLPPYARLDLSVKFTLNKRQDARYQHSLTLSMNNILGHKNVFAVKFNRIAGSGVLPVIKSNVWSPKFLNSTQVHSVRFLPAISYRFNL